MLKRRRYIGGALAAVLLLALGYVLYVKIQGNFHAITPGQAYRSAQLDRDELAHYVKQYNIKSVLNLRGSNAGERWYEDELAACQELKVMHYDVELSAYREPTDTQVRQLLDIFNTAPRPLLIHCNSGADRAGLVAAMWKVAVDKEPKAQAAKQLSICYGHLPLGRTQAMERFFEKWSP
jgi:undecaprenyl-diphosphatase